MAVRKTTDLPGSLRSTDRVTRQRCVARCIEEEFAQAKSNADKFQIMREWEVVLPEIITLNGENKVLAGTKVRQYLGVRLRKPDGSRDEAKSDAMLARLRDENKSLGLPWEELDDEHPDLLAKGMYADVMLDSDEFEYTEPPTPEELALGKKQGKPRIGADGKPEVGYRPKLAYVLGKATPVDGHPW